ncbi:MAG: hypothetical protein MUE46_03475 [Xanthomonadales bacterium]|jgi:hypothetical protein|nr:hypothetical protein [Xanthomonadales bacterium]
MYSATVIGGIVAAATPQIGRTTSFANSALPRTALQRCRIEVFREPIRLQAMPARIGFRVVCR